jgi:ribosomal protein S2
MSSNTNNSSLIERLFSVGAHFGFKKSRRHPTVTPYLYGTKEGNDIFDLEKTAELIDNAKAILKRLV